MALKKKECGISVSPESVLEFSESAAARKDHHEVLSRWKEHIALVKKGVLPSLFSMYVHIPFCSSRCDFCLCSSDVVHDRKDPTAYVSYLIDMLLLYAPVFKGIRFNALYIGGGTPSLLSLIDLDRLLSVIQEQYSFLPWANLSIECNPLDMSAEKIAVLKNNGINYVSLGVQSLQRSVLHSEHRPFISFERLSDIMKELKRTKMFVNLDLNTFPYILFLQYQHGPCDMYDAFFLSTIYLLCKRSNDIIMESSFKIGPI